MSCLTVASSGIDLCLRYMAGVHLGKKNMFQAEISRDIVHSILERPADPSTGSVAKYWPQAVQKQRIQAAFDKWGARGAWSEAANRVCCAFCAPQPLPSDQGVCSLDSPGPDGPRRQGVPCTPPGRYLL
jgi:hypothetical protein